MRPVLAFARLIDAVNNRVGRAVAWLVLVAVLVSTGNAISRYALSLSSNAWLEIQWYLFGDLPTRRRYNDATWRARALESFMGDSPRTRAWIASSAACSFSCRWRCSTLSVLARVRAVVLGPRDVGRAAGSCVAGELLMPLGLRAARIAGPLADREADRYLRGRRRSRRRPGLADRAAGADNVRRPRLVLLIGYPVAFDRRDRPRVRRRRIELGCSRRAAPALPERITGSCEKHAARDPVLHFHGVCSRGAASPKRCSQMGQCSAAAAGSPTP